jgi:hypothetical protein
MMALGDIKGLQIEERDKAQGLQKMVKPPITGPSSLRSVPVSQLPGGLTLYDSPEGRQQLTPLFQLQIPFRELAEDISRVERRIEDAFFVDLFLAISRMEGVQPRNELDLTSRNEERLLQLGPVLERLHGDFLDHLISRLFNQCLKANILPPIPDALSGQPLRVRYVSSLAMAQRAVATQSIDRYAQFAAGLTQAGWQQAMYKFDAVKAMDEYAKAIGVPPTIVPQDAVAHQAFAQAQQQMQAEQAAQAGLKVAQAAKAASGADMSGNNALTSIVNGQ